MVEGGRKLQEVAVLFAETLVLPLEARGHRLLQAKESNDTVRGVDTSIG